MRRIFWTLILLGLAPTSLFAADPPTVEVRVRTLNELTEKFEYLGGVINQAEAAKQATGFVRSLIDEKKGIAGIDPARPIGMYAIVTKDVIDSPIVLMIPLADEQSFIDMLTTQVGLDPKKTDGVYKVDVPNVPAPVYFRAAKNYLFATIQDPKHIDPKGLPEPKAFFDGADRDSVGSVKVHLDRLPDDVKKTVLGQYELKVNDAKERTDPGETPAQKKLRLWALDLLTLTVKLILTEAKDVTANLLIEPESDDLVVNVSLSAKPGTTLAKLIKGLDGRSSVAAGLPVGKNSIAQIALKLALDDSSRKSLEPVIDALIEENLAKAKDVEKQIGKIVLEAIAPTLKAGTLEVGFVANGPDSKGAATAVLGLKVREGEKIEKVVKQFAPFLPEDKGKFTFDIEKIGPVTLHKLVIKEADTISKLGGDTIWLATSDEILLASLEKEGSAIREAAKLTANKVPVMMSRVSITRAAQVLEKGLKPEILKDLVKEAFGKGETDGKDEVQLQLTGGDDLTLRLVMKGKAIKYGVLIDQEKKK